MAKGFTSGGVDFDNLFDPDVVGDGPSAPFLTSGGVALKYAALVYGTKRADVGYRNSAGVDVSNLWAAKGTAVYTDAVAIPFGTYNVEDDVQPNIRAQMSLTLNRDGTWAIVLTPGNVGTVSGTPTSGSWCGTPSAAIGDDYEVRFTADVTVTKTGGATGVPASYTASTGWLPLSSSQGVAADTTRLLDVGRVTIGGTYTVEVRKVGTASVVTSVMPFGLDANYT